MAQERKKTRIVLASILKPVDDTRMFEKMAATLANSGIYEVHIVGYAGTHRHAMDVGLHPLGKFGRLSFQRWFAKWRVLSIVIRLKPDVFIFNTHELLGVSLWLKVFLPVKTIYDIRENYFRNIVHTDSFPWLIRWPLAIGVRWKEKLLAPAVDHFFLAEKGYENEFKFHRGGWTVLENKARNYFHGERKKIPGRIRLLFSGTLGESTGVFEAITLAKELHRRDPSISLTIVGYAALASAQQKLTGAIKGHHYIRLVGGNKLVSHQEIEKAIENSDAGIISYPPSAHTSNSHPTKLYEYLSAALPIIVDRRWPWTSQYAMCDPFLFFDFFKPDYPQLLADLRSGNHYPCLPAGVTWSDEEPKLLEAVAKLV